MSAPNAQPDLSDVENRMALPYTRTSRLAIFALFAAGLLFSMMREWSAPAACPLPAFSGELRNASTTRP